MKYKLLRYGGYFGLWFSKADRDREIDINRGGGDDGGIGYSGSDLPDPKNSQKERRSKILNTTKQTEGL